MTREFSSDACGAITVGIKVVNGANVIETTAGDIVSAGGVSTGHDP